MKKKMENERCYPVSLLIRMNCKRKVTLMYKEGTRILTYYCRYKNVGSRNRSRLRKITQMQRKKNI